jgi:hypothetical protein
MIIHIYPNIAGNRKRWDLGDSALQRDGKSVKALAKRAVDFELSHVH